MIYTKLFKLSYSKVLKPILFLFDPEFVHNQFSFWGKHLGKYQFTRKIVSKLFRYDNEMLEQNVLGINFKNPVGLSAGFDKEANLPEILPSVGFAHMELGSITLNEYKGNKKPRLVRLPKFNSIIVNYGLKNKGAQATLDILKKQNIDKDFILGVSIAKTNSDKTVVEKEGIFDYCETLRLFNESNIGQYYTINISCPNAFGGEPFTTPEKLERLLKQIKQVQTDKPIFVKMPIDLSWKDFDNLVKVIVKYNLDGVVIGNLAKKRTDEIEKYAKGRKGGMSGKLTEELCNDLISKTYLKYKNKLVVIGVGGIFNAQDAYKKIELGATLLQMITGMIYEGPQVIGEINKGLVEILKSKGYKNISEAIGSAHEG